MNAASMPDTSLWKRRLCARVLDAAWQLPLAVAAFMAIDTQAGQPAWTAWAAAVVTAMAVQVCGESVLTWIFGTTPGKAVAGLAVTVHGGGRTPALRLLVLRAMKVALWGYGGWIPPLCLLTAVFNLRSLARGVPLPWERTEAGTQVSARATGALRIAAAWGLAICLPLTAASAWLVLTQERDALRSTLTTQALSRSLSGQWTWLNPLSGTVHTLDSAWRLEQENFYPGKSYTAVFAQGEGSDVSLAFRVYWRPSTLEPSCVLAQALVEDHTYLVTGRSERAAPQRLDCEIEGGTLQAGKALRKSTKAAYFPASGAYFLLVATTPVGNDEARADTEALRASLAPDVGQGQFEDGRLQAYFWRNDVTGRVASVPASWELYSLGIADGAAALAFVKWGATEAELAALRCQPRQRGDDWRRASAEQFAEGRWFGQFAWQADAGDALSYSLLDNQQLRGRVFFLEGKTCGWTMIWENADAKDVVRDIEAHELMRSLVATLR